MDLNPTFLLFRIGINRGSSGRRRDLTRDMNGRRATTKHSKSISTTLATLACHQGSVSRAPLLPNGLRTKILALVELSMPALLASLLLAFHLHTNVMTMAHTSAGPSLSVENHPMDTLSPLSGILASSKPRHTFPTMLNLIVPKVMS